MSSFRYSVFMILFECLRLNVAFSTLCRSYDLYLGKICFGGVGLSVCRSVCKITLKVD